MGFMVLGLVCLVLIDSSITLYHVHEILSIFWDAGVRSTIESGHDSRTPCKYKATCVARLLLSGRADPRLEVLSTVNIQM